jgi:hypothetical protein
MALAIFKGTITDCSQPNSIGKITSMGIDPIFPMAGDNSTIWVAYDLSKQVSGGSVKYSYWVNFIPFAPTVIDLCSQEACPLEPAFYNSSGSSIFPDVSGRVEIKIEWTDQDNQQIWCTDTIYSI